MASQMFMTNDVFHSTAKIKIPVEIDALLLHINNTMRDGNEYGVYLSGDLDLETFTINVNPEAFHIPKQEVSAAHIRFIEHRSDPDLFNMVIHRHPAGVTNFSGTDNASINEDFDISCLFIPQPVYKYEQPILGASFAPGVAAQDPAFFADDPFDLESMFPMAGRRGIINRRRMAARSAAQPADFRRPVAYQPPVLEGYKSTYPRGILNYPVDRKKGIWIRLAVEFEPIPIYNPGPYFKAFLEDGIDLPFLKERILSHSTNAMYSYPVHY